MKISYFITRSKQKNALYIFTEDDFKKFGDQLIATPMADNRTAAMLVMYFMETAVSVDMEKLELTEMINAIKDIPKLWDYLTGGKEAQFHEFQMEKEEVEGRAYNPWIITYHSDK